ncbi:hypothetical protein JOF49_002015 [Corynebacterium suicordis]|nr:hypothetical protein [Corynebacterium suicordis]
MCSAAHQCMSRTVLAAPNPTSLLELFGEIPRRWQRHRGMYRDTVLPLAVFRVSADALAVLCARSPAGGRALKAGSRRNHPAAFRRVLILVHTPCTGCVFSFFDPRSLRQLYVRAATRKSCSPAVRRIHPENFVPRAPPVVGLISWENLFSFLRFQDWHFASLTNRHFVPSRAKNEEVRQVADGSPIHYQVQGGHHECF